MYESARPNSGGRSEKDQKKDFSGKIGWVRPNVT